MPKRRMSIQPDEQTQYLSLKMGRELKSSKQRLI